VQEMGASIIWRRQLREVSAKIKNGDLNLSVG
jgi:hypothetical protein